MRSATYCHRKFCHASKITQNIGERRGSLLQNTPSPPLTPSSPSPMSVLGAPGRVFGAHDCVLGAHDCVLAAHGRVFRAHGRALRADGAAFGAHGYVLGARRDILDASENQMAERKRPVLLPFHAQRALILEVCLAVV